MANEIVLVRDANRELFNLMDEGGSLLMKYGDLNSEMMEFFIPRIWSTYENRINFIIAISAWLVTFIGAIYTLFGYYR